MATVAPSWLDKPQKKWISCSVEGILDPGEYAVQIQINGHQIAAAVPRDDVKAPDSLPSEGTVRVTVVANLPDDRVLADLPAAPLNGTRRISVEASRLHD